MKRTHLQRGSPHDVSHPADNGNPCRQGHELFRPNLRDIDFVISPSTMIKAIFFRFMAVLDNLFNIYLRAVCGIFNQRGNLVVCSSYLVSW